MRPIANTSGARRFRDREWLRTGRIPTVGYDSEKTREKKERDPNHADEFHTATIIASHGYRMVFWDDERPTPKVDGKGTDTVGLADLDTGVEIKTVYGASALSTFDKHVRNTKGKGGVSRLVIDVSENPNLTGERASELIAEALRNRRYPEAMMIGHGRQIVRVYPAKTSIKKR